MLRIFLYSFQSNSSFSCTSSASLHRLNSGLFRGFSSGAERSFQDSPSRRIDAKKRSRERQTARAERVIAEISLGAKTRGKFATDSKAAGVCIRLASERSLIFVVTRAPALLINQCPSRFATVSEILCRRRFPFLLLILARVAAHRNFPYRSNFSE